MAEPRILGWERVADGSACDFCQEVDGAVTAEADAMPLHNGCGCGLEAIVEEGAGLKNVKEVPFQDFAETPIPDSVAVNEHGEMGPMLGAAGDNFTSEADLPEDQAA